MDELILSDYFAILRRWKKLFAIVCFLLASLSLAVALQWHNYRAVATVQIEPQEIASAATTPTGVNPRDAQAAFADQHISALQQKVLSTASLIEVITKFDLYASQRKDTPVAAVAETMRKKIKLDLVSGSLANPAAAAKVSADQLSAIAFDLSFDYGNPLIAQQVTDELVSRFLDEDLQQRRSQAENTSAFLGNQIAALETSMQQQEAKIADYQKAHGSTRPESLAFNQQAVASLNLSMQSVNSQITANEGQLGALHAQLAGLDPYSRVVADGQVMTSPSVQLKSLQTQYAALTAQYGPEHPDVVKLRHQIEALKSQTGGRSRPNPQLKAQFDDVRSNLAAAEKIYGADHPDVVALRRQAQKLEQQMAQSHEDVTGMGAGDADNPAYLQAVSQIRAAEEQRKALVEQRNQLQAQQDSYQKAILENPEAARQMQELSRDYENAQGRYRDLKQKKMAADMDQQMQKDRHGGRLTLINPPELPLHTHPGRLLILLAGLVVALIGGSISIVMAQIIKQCVVGPHHLESIVGVAPLVAIPRIATPMDTDKKALFQLQKLTKIFTNRLNQGQHHG